MLAQCRLYGRALSVKILLSLEYEHRGKVDKWVAATGGSLLLQKTKEEFIGEGKGILRSGDFMVVVYIVAWNSREVYRQMQSTKARVASGKTTAPMKSRFL